MGTVFGQYAAHGFGSDRGEDWRKSAACRNQDPEMFYPIGDSSISALQAQQAEDFCNTECPVQEKCLKWALSTREQHGVWGGMSAKKRIRILSKGEFEPDPKFRPTRQCKDCKDTFEIPAKLPTATVCERCAAPHVIRKRAKAGTR